jgi:hypothetical protein
MKLIPRSKAVWTVRIATDSSTGLKTPPREDAPKLSTETFRPVLPRVRYFKTYSPPQVKLEVLIGKRSKASPS